MSSWSPTASRDEAVESSELRLHLNENPYGCSLLVQESLAASLHLSQRPGALPRPLVQSLSRYAGRPAGQIHLANSPEELLARLLMVLGASAVQVMGHAPAGEVLASAAGAVGARVISATTARSGIRPGADGADMPVYAASPHHLTGQVPSAQRIVSHLRAGRTVILDETYVEFADRRLGTLGAEFPNAITVRSFAPWAGLWGIPVSYALVSPDVRERLEARWPHGGLTAASRIAAGASLDDLAALSNGVKHIRLERARLFRQLRKLNFVQPEPSHGPFVFCRVTRGTSDRVCELLAAERVLVHDAGRDGVAGYIRVSVGTPEATDQLMQAMCRIAARI